MVKRARYGLRAGARPRSLQVFVRIERRHAAGAGRGDRLTVDVVGYIARCEHARHAGRGRLAVASALDHDVTAAHLELSLEQLRVRLMPTAMNTPSTGIIARALAVQSAQAHSGDPRLVAQDLLDGVVPHDGHLAGRLQREKPVLQYLLGPEPVAPMHQGHVRGDVGQIERLFHRRIAAADDGHRSCRDRRTRRRSRRPRRLCRGMFPPKAGRDIWPMPRWRRSAHRRCIRRCRRAAETGAAELHPADVVEHDVGVEPFGVPAHTLHQLRGPADARHRPASCPRPSWS